ncbi:unnamed protein product [Chondrus crispus]|uniref:Uncharacterized protein n=1 Tax=Chondrus crispus TaxID=2769 RepID=R7QFW3_CHOCR|nr:unnamed protein product [Chondrus crispus]CDF36346.1 unnamed protein product [Chondrus crispus]|eukprot:XP_005716165.1 unnamed protein product [Chondrus crispus]
MASAKPPEPPEQSPTNSFRRENARLLSLLGRPPQSDCSDSTFHLSVHPILDGEDQILPVNPSPTAVRHSVHPHSAPLGPVPLPGLESAVNLWLTSHDIPPDEIPTGAALCAAVGKPCRRYFRRKLAVFRQAAQGLHIDSDDIPAENDLRLRRSWPRVLHVLARVAAALDPEGWQAAVATSQPPLQMPEKVGWRECVLNESWAGDWLLRRMAEAHGEETCTIAVAGTQGGGKSATVSRLLGRVGRVESHAFSCAPAEEEMDPGEKETARKLRHLRALTFPDVPIEVDTPTGESNVDRSHVKVDGKTVTFLELPSMEEILDYTDESAIKYSVQYGNFDEVVESVQGEFVDYVLLVDRMDDLEEEKMKRIARRLRRIYGRHVLEKTIVVLTHGQELPPGDLSFDVWMYDRIRVVRELLQKAHGKRRPLHIPIVVFENSHHCRIDETSGRPVLADNTDFLERFLSEFRQLVHKNAETPPLAPIPPRRWWENYVILICFGVLASRLV